MEEPQVTHRFDTGASKPQRTLIQEGIVELLSGLARPAGYLMEVLAWDGIVRTYTDYEGVAELVDLVVKTPSVAVSVADASMDVAGINGYQSKKIIDVLVYVASGHKRRRPGRGITDVVGLADDRADPGCHVIMEHVTELMIGQRGSITSIKQIRPDREELLYTSPPVNIWLQTYKVEARTNVSEFRTATQLLKSIHWRAAIDLNEVNRPAPATSPASIDVDSDNLDPGT